jgi:hypothetical protein
MQFSEAAQNGTPAGVSAIVIITVEEHLASFLRAGVGVRYDDDRL